MHNAVDNISAWKLERLGKVTSSESSKLLKGGTRPMTEHELKTEKENKGRRTTVETPFGDGAITYIESKVAEIITGETGEESFSNAIEYGRANEMDAFLTYKRNFADPKGLSTEYFGVSNPLFVPYGSDAGGSPDGYVGEDGLIEIKAPYNSTNHVKYLRLKNQYDLKKLSEEYYTQIQANLLFCDKKWAHFISYDPRVVSYKFRLKVLEIQRDEEFITLLQKKIELASKEINSILRQIGFIETVPVIYDENLTTTIIN